MKKFLFAMALTGGFLAQGQSNQHGIEPCGTDQVYRELMERFPELEIRRDALIRNSLRSRSTGDSILVIPVVFHILHEYGSDNIPKARILNELERMNEYFQRLNADITQIVPAFQGIIGKTNVEFRLATKDPSGNCTDGINRIPTNEARFGAISSKINQWAPDRYLNIYTAQQATTARPTPGLVLAYATFPGTSLSSDGIMCRHDAIYGSNSPNDDGWTLIHEVGHYLGLLHPWGDGQVNTECDDDGISDTPVTKGSFSCNLNKRECTEVHGEELFFSEYGNGSGNDSLNNYIELVNGTGSDLDLTNYFIRYNRDGGTWEGEFNFGGHVISASDSTYVIVREGASATLIAQADTIVSDSLNGVVSYNGNDVLGLFKINASNNDTLIDLIGYYSEDPDSSYDPGDGFDVDGIANATQGHVLVRKDHLPTGLINWDYSAGDTISTPSSWVVTNENDWSNVGQHFFFEGIIENVQNFMDYAGCGLPQMFTTEQSAYMREQLIFGRPLISVPSNLAFTGTNVTSAPDCAPAADFHAGRTFTCVGETVRFFDDSYRADGYTLSWTFPDGTPPSSSDPDPSVVFNSPGWKEVTLTVTNAQGSSTVTKKAVHISPTFAVLGPDHVESFEDHTAYWWRIENYLDNEQEFVIGGSAASVGSRSAMLRNYRNLDPDAVPPDPDFWYYQRLGGRVDRLVSPPYDLSAVQSGSLKFDYAYATNAAFMEEITEELRISVSRNCGRTWITLRTLSQDNLNLVTGGSFGGQNFVPDASEWATVDINVGSAVGRGHVMFRFEFTSGDLSNNLYIDNIRFDAVISVDENELSSTNMNIYPNPANEHLYIEVPVVNGDETLVIYNAAGQLIYEAPAEANVTKMTVEVADWARGVYHVQWVSSANTLQSKFVH